MSGNYAPDCLSCDIERGRPKVDFVYKSDRWTVNHRIPENGKSWPGWLVAQPRRHVSHVGELTDVELNELGHVLANVDAVLRDQGGADRTYIASLGVTPETHLHFHLAPQHGDSFEGAKALSIEPSASADTVLKPLKVPSPSEQEQFGLTRIVEWTSRQARNLSPYVAIKAIYRRWAASRPNPPGIWIAAEIYTIAWVLLLTVGLALMWTLDDVKAIAVVVVVAAIVRLVDILATATGIVLFEGQSRSFAGVASLQRTVLLGFVNLFEIILVTAIFSSSVEILSTRAAFSPEIQSGVDAFEVAFGPIGIAGASPNEATALVAVVAGTLSLAYMLVLTVAVFVSNLTGSLRRDFREQARK